MTTLKYVNSIHFLSLKTLKIIIITHVSSRDLDTDTLNGFYFIDRFWVLRVLQVRAPLGYIVISHTSSLLSFYTSFSSTFSSCSSQDFHVFCLHSWIRWLSSVVTSWKHWRSVEVSQISVLLILVRPFFFGVRSSEYSYHQIERINSHFLWLTLYMRHCRLPTSLM